LTGHGPPNADGVAFYNKLIDCLLEHGIEPYVTLYHWDLPNHLQNEFGGWLDHKIVPAFAEYGKLLCIMYSSPDNAALSLQDLLYTGAMLDA
jgi:beta-glucosidase/6-phospho-beta-glucosidase/beta-galactosidase